MLSTGDVLARTDLDRSSRPEWLPSGEAFVVGGESVPRLIDASTGDVLDELTGQMGGTWSYDMIPGTSLMLSGGLFGGETVIFDLSDSSGVELGGWSAPTLTTWRAYYQAGGTGLRCSDRDSIISTDASTGKELLALSAGGLAVFPDGEPDREI